MRKILPFILIAVFLLLPASQAAADTPYTTWVLGPGRFPVLTQDAYSPVAEVDLPLNSPEDMFITPDGAIYVADTGNGLIVKLEDFEVVATYGEGILQGPSGLFVDEDGAMYIADAKQDAIVILDADGNLVNQFGRPDEPLFGKNRQFLPRKITVDARKNLYIISEGSVNGIIQMNTDGDFIGYFGANAASMSLKMILQRTFLTEEQLSQFVVNEAASPSNIAIDHQSMIYTITAGTQRSESIRKFTVSGKNLFPEIWGSNIFRDIHISDQGLVLAVDGEGSIFEYDLNGQLLFTFGAFDSGEQRIGALRNPSAIERHGENIYVLDQDKNAITVYQTTEFAKVVHEGVRLYMDGYYLEARPYFEQVLDYNGSFVLAYQGIADAYYKERDYSNALTAYRYAEDRTGYSNAYWELRNVVLQRYLTGAFFGLAALGLGQGFARRMDRRYHWLDPFRKRLQGLQKIRLVDDFIFMFRFIKQPVDSFYYIKKNMRGSLLFATLMYAWVIIVRLASLYLTGFVFSPYPSPAYIDVENEALVAAGLILLWNAANYLVSTISDGEGRVRDVIIGSAYSLFPYALFALPIALISNVLSLNEIFLFTFSQQLMAFWVGLMLFIMVKEIHNYTFTETIRNILITLFTMALFVLTGYILSVLFNQLFEFVSAIFQEVSLRG